MQRKRRAIFLFTFFLTLSQLIFSQDSIKHFIFFSRDREFIHHSSFYLNPGITGAQITYPWRILEPRKDKYDFREIEEDFNFLNSKGKKLFIQLQDVTFYSAYFAVPEYILTDTVYHGGANLQYHFPDDDQDRPIKGGWVSRRWDEAVAGRFHKLIFELAKRFDGKIEGINLPESSVEFGTRGSLHPPGFTYEKYFDAIKKNMNALREAFSKSTVIQYLNFMPGGSPPKDGKFYLRNLYDFARQMKVGVGGPDILVYRKFQMENSYGLIRESHGIIPTGVAVQEGNYDVLNPKTGKQVTIPEILDFARNYLRLDYVFWYRQEPYYSNQLLPLLESLNK
jgi:hypothetical protein